ncbi:trypsin-like peptidase domain-containing protein [Glycomyces sp. TRM65418]|uniref:S1C family serine protease n=1 Tax=Glycomyces sp. TRM65418 TaxID=2867006 RepID=UPI001CE5A799|nr:trypsin-like peptidase domain-containing protein [Glycomyces sp. TRM65418]MCC3765752.1 trypsin-like peptidase domain-containing protein [Glycomyces sp. TRM65418]QZD55342.1 trypsin-like peptidase domain-containing protein [Glycomyces sp. TRM65418]
MNSGTQPPQADPGAPHHSEPTWRAPSAEAPQPHGPAGLHTGNQPPTAGPGQSAWWHPAAATDPWRDPASHAVIETRPVPHAPAPEPLPARPAERARPALGLVIVVSAVTALIAGTLGAAIGIWATRTGAGGGFITGAEPRTERDVDSVAAVVEEIMPSVVTVLTADGGNGSGFIVSDDGYIMTNHHVVVGGGAEVAESLQVLFSDGSVTSAEVVGSDPDSDVAVLKIEGDEHPPMVLADSDLVAVGDPVLAVGAPLGLSSTVTEGIVSAVDRPVLTQNNNGEVESVMAAIQTDAAINPGNSGGPLTDIAGQVIGINTAIASTAAEGEAGNIGIGFAIPINQAKRIADEIVATGSATHTVLGAELGASELGVGVTLERIVPDSPADDAGLRDGDVLTAFDGTTVTENTQLIALIRKLAPGTEVTVVYERDGREHSAQVTLEAAAD